MNLSFGAVGIWGLIHDVYGKEHYSQKISTSPRPPHKEAKGERETVDVNEDVLLKEGWDQIFNLGKVRRPSVGVGIGVGVSVAVV